MNARLNLSRFYLKMWRYPEYFYGVLIALVVVLAVLGNLPHLPHGLPMKSAVEFIWRTPLQAAFEVILRACRCAVEGGLK